MGEGKAMGLYKLDITTGKGYSKRVTSRHFFMTQQGLFNAEELFEKQKIKPEVRELRLCRQDTGRIYELKHWQRDEGEG